MQLATRMPDGSPLRQHLQAAAAAGARPDPRLASRPPAVAAALWGAFVALHATRQAGMGPSAITASELLAWQQLHGVRLTPWEAETLQAMDRSALAVMAAAKPKGH